MTLFQIAAIILIFASLGSFLNYKFANFPSTIAQMLFGLILSLSVIGFGELGWMDPKPIQEIVQSIDFSKFLLHGILSFLLFAGALHINLLDLKAVKVSVGVLATVGVVLATFITGTIVWYAAQFIGIELPYIYALVFGALISPTDPIAVLSILGQMGISKKAYTRIGGESLFNDGVGIVVFLTILAMASGGGELDVAEGLKLFFRESIGGLGLGIILGLFGAYIMKIVDDHKLEILFSLTLVVAGYSFAEFIHVSAPLCMVAAGLIVGMKGYRANATLQDRSYVYTFWELIDEVLNSVLFLLVGFEILVVPIYGNSVLLGIIAIAAVLIGRLISVAVPIKIIGLKGYFEKGTITLLTWGGLRGGLSIAMALSLPNSPEKSLILTLTYCVVVFSIIVQGLTFQKVAEHVVKEKKK